MAATASEGTVKRSAVRSNMAVGAEHTGGERRGQSDHPPGKEDVSIRLVLAYDGAMVYRNSRRDCPRCGSSIELTPEIAQGRRRAPREGGSSLDAR
jgi:hypothetical protein